MKRTLAAALLLALPFLAHSQTGAAPVRVTLDTTQGKIVLELDAAKAPKSTANFVEYARSGHYDGTVFHRIIPGFMAQGGGFGQDYRQKPTRAPIANEGGNGLKNKRGTVAMARTSDPDSATAQFFINLVDNGFLDRSPGNDGYAVFGKVVEGMDVVDKMAAIPTGRGGPFGTDVPQTPVIIQKATVAEK
ncbi:MAG TPA: peptidylprolyl isomerase [Candidatus Binatia bacterium]|nr:peptidylprolyl isomerase [Candidatus Binatia bacterium]